MELVFATQNRYKLEEIQHMLGSGFQLKSLEDIGLKEEIPEPHETLEENALAKARYVYEKTGRNCFADDTGLEVDALGGAPGVYSARYAAEYGPFENQHQSFRANIDKLLRELNVTKQRGARFRTVIALIFEGEEHLFEGMVNGDILEEARGTEGFGYDPVFQPEGVSLSFAEMQLEDKNRISHRARAFRKLGVYLQTRGSQFPSETI